MVPWVKTECMVIESALWESKAFHQEEAQSLPSPPNMHTHIRAGKQSSYQLFQFRLKENWGWKDFFVTRNSPQETRAPPDTVTIFCPPSSTESKRELVHHFCRSPRPAGLMESLHRTTESSRAPSVHRYHLCFTRLVKEKNGEIAFFSASPQPFQRIYLKYPPYLWHPVHFLNRNFPAICFSMRLWKK